MRELHVESIESDGQIITTPTQAEPIQEIQTTLIVGEDQPINMQVMKDLLKQIDPNDVTLKFLCHRGDELLFCAIDIVNIAKDMKLSK